jgi:hypothetical protein
MSPNFDSATFDEVDERARERVVVRGVLEGVVDDGAVREVLVAGRGHRGRGVTRPAP